MAVQQRPSTCCAALWLQAGQKQLARLAREEALAGLSVELASGKLVPLGALRGFARVVICAGSPQQLKVRLERTPGYLWLPRVHPVL